MGEPIMRIYPFLPNHKPHQERYKEKENVLELPVPQHHENIEEPTETAPSGSNRGICIIDLNNDDMMSDVIID